MRCSRFVIAFLLALCAVAFNGFAASKPNILIILADDMGFSDLGCYGGEIATPNLDALAKGGLRFTQFYNTTRCWPSRGCIMTGYYAQQIRRDTLPDIPSGGRGVRPRWSPLMTEFLRPLGYRCYHSGKWHIDGKPLKNGFDHSYETSGQDNNFSSGEDTEDAKPVAQSPDYYSTTAFASHAIKCLKDHAKKFPDRPFFQYLCFIAPHFPLQAPAADIARYDGKYLRGWNAIAQERFERMTKMGLVHHALPQMEREVGPPYPFPDALLKLGPDEVNRPLPWDELTEAQHKFQAAKMAIHAAMIDRIDEEIGRVVAQLKAMGAYDNTLILFASDNGASAEIMVRGDGHDPNAPPGSAKSYLCLGPGWSSAANTPLRRHKTWVHEGGISTPLIVHWPAGITARGELRHNPAHFIDVVPTVLEVTGAKKPKTISGFPVPAAPGKSLVRVFKKDGTLSHDYFWWLHEDNRAIRVGDWKLVALANGQWELYNLATDRGESHNLAEEYPDKVRELSALWEKQTEDTRQLALTDLLPVAPVGKKAKVKTD
ncbi:MAG: arylsulfatase [Verrucomicrobia bacterium]|nr:arylsulfatase [Verrucomicrobiota bacterium]